MKPQTVLPLLALAALLPSCDWMVAPVPTGPNIDINGNYTGRLVGSDNKTALLDVTIVEKEMRVTATVKSLDNGQTFTLTGTRSVYNSSPVSVNVTADLGSGSVCTGGFTEKYSVSATFYTYKKDTGSGYVNHLSCNASTRQYEQSSFNYGSLELARK